MKRLIVALMLLPAISLPAQEQRTPPVFKAGTEVVLVDFVVSDKADRPVTGLTASDFLLKEDGKERPIVSFAAFAEAEPAATPASSPTGPSVSVSAARAAAAGATVLLVDDSHLTPEQSLRLRPDLKALLAKMSARSGTLSLVAPLSKVSEARTLPFGATELSSAVDRITGQQFQDHSDLPVADTEAIAVDRGDQTMIERIVGRFMALNPALKPDQALALTRSRSTEVVSQARMRRDDLYRFAMLGFEWLATQPGRHSLVIVSPGFARDPSDAANNAIVTRSLRVNAPISFIDVRGLQGFGRFENITFGAALPPNTGETAFARIDAAEGSSRLADETGGITIRNTNDMQKGLGRLFDTMSTYYVVGYEHVPQTKPGFRKINVETRTKGLTVRARRGYYDAGR